ncbi:MAG: DNA polymerase I [Myxococcales bacterium]|nr:DNA polymerase I [Myxococcales bacterium]HIK84285.1 DNA polymerase I [Myxococcales bacterium]
MTKQKNSAKHTPHKRLVVIDGANAIYRAFFAIPNLRAPDGTPTGAAYGFVTMLIKVLREENPTHIVIASDPRGGSFRRDIYPEYKAGRDAQPEDLTVQFPIVSELCAAFGVQMLEVPKFEADDVIATLVETAPEGAEVCIVSTDKDLMQLVRPGVEMLDSGKGRRIDAAAVVERFGVPPSQLLDVRALVGDPSDNIPGVKGIGEKGAAKLILEFGSLDRLLEQADQVKAKRAREGLQAHADDARLSRELSTLRSDVPLDGGWDALGIVEPNKDKLRELYKRFGFTRLRDALEEEMSDDPEAKGEGARPAELAFERAERATVDVVQDDKALGALARRLSKAKRLALHPVFEKGTAVSRRLSGLALSLPGQSNSYLAMSGDGLFDQAGIGSDALCGAVRTIFAGDAKPEWLAVESKIIQSYFAQAGLVLPLPRLDVEVAAGMIDSSGGRQLSTLAFEYLGSAIPSWEDLAGRGARAKSAQDLGVEAVSGWAALQAQTMVEIGDALLAALDTNGLADLYNDFEIPLTAVLARMECAGVRVDEGHLKHLSEEYEKELARLESEIYESAGEKFLVGSPKQLQVILFEKLSLPILKKTKTGYSTAESVLEQLTEHHELPGKVLAWRKLSKLKSTYIDALPRLIDEGTGRIHPTFHQLGAATGRLSASNPNVQNIPIRGSEGARIREAFVPAAGRILLSADYSQVELRILAYYSGDASLVAAFRNGEDIHRRTAAEVAGISIDEVSDEQRARAKAVNFGIIYGSSAFGLSQQLGIAAGEAQETIDTYFKRYEGVRRFLDETIETAKKDGCVRTLMGRRRNLPDLSSRNRVLRQAAERMATNTVIQGTAADLIKKAMVDLDRVLAGGEIDATMILQVHDELVFETTEAAKPDLSVLVREKMEGVADLEVPLTIDLGSGPNWRVAH